MRSVFVLDALTTWTAIYAVATIALAVATTLLVLVGLYAARWARRTFGQQELDAVTRHQPYLAVWLAPPQALIAGNYTWNTDDQVSESLRWLGIVWQRDIGRVAALPAMQQRMVCFVHNLGEGMAVRVRVPYRLTVKNVLEDRTLSGPETFEGAFEIYHVGAGVWQSCARHIEVTYYPWWQLELLLDRVVVTGLQGIEFRTNEVLAETSQIASSKEFNNDEVWRLKLGLPNYGEPVPPAAGATGGLGPIEPPP